MNCKQHYPFFAVRRRKGHSQQYLQPSASPACWKEESFHTQIACTNQITHCSGREKQKEDESKRAQEKMRARRKARGVCDSPAFCLVTPQPQIQPLTCWRYIKEINLQWWHFTYQQASRKDFFMQKLIKYSSYLSYNHITKLS